MRSCLWGFCFLDKDAPRFLQHGFPVRSSLRGFLFSGKVAPGFLEHGFSVRTSLRVFGFLGKEAFFPSMLPKKPPRAPLEPPRTDPELYSLPVPPRLSCDVFSTFVGMSQAKPHFLTACWIVTASKHKHCLKVDEAVLQKSKE